MAVIALIRKSFRIQITLVFVASCFATGCAQGPKAFFANAWESGRDGASNLASKISPRKNKDGVEEGVVAKKDGKEGIKTVSMEDEEDQSGSIFSAWIRNGTDKEHVPADPFLNKAWVKKVKRENSIEQQSDKVINVSRETSSDDPIVINEDVKSGNQSELDKLLASIDNSGETVTKNEFVDGVGSNLNELKASLKKDEDTNNQIVIPDVDNSASKELVEKKMILAETFLAQGDVESARKIALEAEAIVKKENLDYQQDSPSEFLDRISQNETSAEPTDSLVLTDEPEVPETKTTKQSQFDLSFPHQNTTTRNDSFSNGGWKSEDDFAENSFNNNRARSTGFNSNRKTSFSKKADTSMIVDTESLPERDNIRDDFQNSQKEKKASVYSPDDWDTSATEEATKKSESVSRIRPSDQFESSLKEADEVKANRHSQIQLASHEKNTINPMGSVKVQRLLTSEAVEEEDVIYEESVEDLEDAPVFEDEEIAMGPIDSEYLDEKFEEESASGGISIIYYPIIAGLIFFACAAFSYLKRRKTPGYSRR